MSLFKGSDTGKKILILPELQEFKWFINKDTGALLTEDQMRKQWEKEYDGWDETNLLSIRDHYEEVVRIELEDNSGKTGA